MAVRISAPGGSGENGRNCFLLQCGAGSFLFDCGVLRETRGDAVGGYPALTPELVRSLDAVFLSHAHEDHSAALPLLYALGYRGRVYASPETADAAPAMIRKWMRFVRARGGTLPYSEKDAEAPVFSPLPLGESTVCGLPVLTGRSGHTPGGLWFSVRADGKTVLFSGDLCPSSPTLAFDPPPPCDAVLLDCASAGRTADSAAQDTALSRLVRRCAETRGVLLFPLPAVGRGSDVLLRLLPFTELLPVYAEKAIADACLALKARTGWLKRGVTVPDSFPGLRIVGTDAEREAACRERFGVYLVTDGMLTAPESAVYLAAFREDGNARCVLTGHAAAGTPAAELLSGGSRMRTERLTLPVHPDAAELQKLLSRLGAGTGVCFHAPAEDCGWLAELGLRCLAPGETLTV